MTTDKQIEVLNRQAGEYSRSLAAAAAEIARVMVGQQEAADRLLTALVAGGHVLLEGVPGIAKTLLVRTLAQTIDCSFARIQFTPDLLPADITGTTVFRQDTCSFATVKGPVFHHCILADEINRAPPKVQSALLEAMQERQVTIQGETWPLPDPFFVLATQNPIESEGTYPLPEAQVDRFMFKTLMTYPSRDEEIAILERFTGGEVHLPSPALSAADVAAVQAFCREVYADAEVMHYVASLVDATRHPAEYAVESGGYLAFGASPRASLSLLLGAKANAVRAGRGYVIPDDVKGIARDALRHRLMLTYEGEAEGIAPDTIIDEVLLRVPVP
ncbi:ATPase [Methanomicrobiaceae archaeon CYW5]|uniref:AAA family ATPase n=1 Tax=Methanovulcanius yangii TaxID=1789227 RepID=UPI0029CA657E|nr:MoxR family ATPase [Methanovulcanius yangii]MBT8508574.1 ATPase [Methanovulcanius yangii]